MASPLWHSDAISLGYAFTVALDVKDPKTHNWISTASIPRRHQVHPTTGKTIVQMNPGDRYRIRVESKCANKMFISVLVDGVPSGNSSVKLRAHSSRTYEGWEFHNGSRSSVVAPFVCADIAPASHAASAAASSSGAAPSAAAAAAAVCSPAGIIHVRAWAIKQRSKPKHVLSSATLSRHGTNPSSALSSAKEKKAQAVGTAPAPSGFDFSASWTSWSKRDALVATCTLQMLSDFGMTLLVGLERTDPVAYAREQARKAASKTAPSQGRTSAGGKRKAPAAAAAAVASAPAAKKRGGASLVDEVALDESTGRGVIAIAVSDEAPIELL